MPISRCCVWALADLVGCTLHFPCAPSPWLFLQTACVQGHGRMPGASRWSCRISEWALDRVLPLVQWLRKRQCNDALALGLSRSPALCLSGSWTACRKAAAPSPVPCCPHAAYPPPSTSSSFTTEALLRCSPLDYSSLSSFFQRPPSCSSSRLLNLCGVTFFFSPFSPPPTLPAEREEEKGK